MKYAWIRQHHDAFSVSAICETLKVANSDYYAWRDRRPSPRAQRTVRIEQAVQRVHVESHGTYGSVKVARVLTSQDDLERAIETRRPNGEQLLHHSDRGRQCTSSAYQQALRGYPCRLLL